MPDYPAAAPAILTDIILYSTDVAAHVSTGLVVRAIFEPATQTMTVQVLSEIVPEPRVIAQRTIFTGAVSPKKETVSPDDVEKAVLCEAYPHEGMMTCEKCGFNRATWEKM